MTCAGQLQRNQTLMTIRGPAYYVCPYLWSRTTKTGQWACLTTASETLPISARLMPPWPLLPTTISPALVSSAKATISCGTPPSLKCTCATVPPADCTSSTASSSIYRPLCSDRLSSSSSSIGSSSSAPSGSAASG